MKRFFVIFLFCLACLMGCGPKRRTNRHHQGLKAASNLKLQIKRDRTVQKFKLELLGIECKFCARAAVELLEKIPGVILAEYVCGNSTDLDRPVSLNQADQNLSDQFGPGEITSMLDAVYNETQLGKKCNHNSTPAHSHTADRSVNHHVNNFPGYVNLYYKPRENSNLSSVQIKQVLNSDGFDLKTIQ